MVTTFLDITTQASSPVIQAYGGSDLLINGDFESGTANLVAAFNPAGNPPGATGIWELGQTPTISEEIIHKFEGTKSLQWSNNTGASSTSWIRQVIAVTPEMLGGTIHYSGYVKAATSVGATIQLGFWTEGSGAEDNKPDGFSPAMTGAFLDSSSRVRLNYNNSQWYFFQVYYRIPSDPLLAPTQVGPMIRPVANRLDGQVVYLDGIRMFVEPAFRSESWDMTLEPINNLVYGYGYGNAFRDDDLLPELFNYFSVIGVLGSDGGFGLASTSVGSDLPADLIAAGYSYSFGYENAPAFLSNSTDSVTVKATIFENDVRQPGIRVVFKAGPTVVLTPPEAITDSNGEATTKVSISSEAVQFTRRENDITILSQIPVNGYLRIEAEIDKHPEKNEGVYLIKTEAVQLTSSDIITTLNIGTYAFGNRYATAFGFDGGYGYG